MITSQVVLPSTWNREPPAIWVHSTSDWISPYDNVDLKTLSNAGFDEIVDSIAKQRRKMLRNGGLPELDLSNDWHLITPELAYTLLLCNMRNREVKLSVVRYYVRMMQEHDWQPTGQTVLIDTKGHLLDGQHRLFACLLSGEAFISFVVTDVPYYEYNFAYIDNSSPRTPEAQIETAGKNGLSRLLKNMVTIDYQFSNGLFPTNKASASPMDRMSPRQFINYLDENPALTQGAKFVVPDYVELAHDIVGNVTITGFVASRIVTLWDEDTADRFFQELIAVSQDEEASKPVELFWAMVQKDRKQKNTKDRMRKHMLLGILINTFNAWLTEDKPKSVAMKSPGKFPAFLTKESPETEGLEHNKDEEESEVEVENQHVSADE